MMCFLRIGGKKNGQENGVGIKSEEGNIMKERYKQGNA